MFKYNLMHHWRSLVSGVETKIPLKNGQMTTYINFDNAATTPPLLSVLEEVVAFSPWYSSIHRGTGYKSQLSSDRYEKSRELIGHFVGADLEKNTVIFLKNATEAINKLSYRLSNQSPNPVVLSSFMEHHSNDLPWRDKYRVDYVDIKENGCLSLEDLEHKLIHYKGEVKLVAITGASNVTGCKNPINRIANIVHQYGAQLLVDGAQLIPHAPFYMSSSNPLENPDYLVFSAHKMYAPFGIGVLIAPKDVFRQGPPEYVGGGTVELVTHDHIKWADVPNREEAGSPNILGVVALTAAMKTLNEIGMEHIDRHEQSLTRYTLEKLNSISDITVYGDMTLKNRVGIISFNIEGLTHDLVAKILSDEGGIAVRNGCFCAQPYVQRLLGIPPDEVEKRKEDPTLFHPGMVRVSFGFYNTYREIDIFISLLKRIIQYKGYYVKKYTNHH
ncbi:Cysteine desulfurase [Alkaliphilus metalliredigens QYMF]|uniref:Cysteine desulfurase n=1 Tax=Alkaliphilus metalliredigens (strain QYMF) TaxID=293826 RepID=A6TMX7_ALKMQ|nr:aminotransferase class V-fold PLP-dependent enzyme [Alkaliphilus metalliredigens]ABR47545.1 Cysteine desulfurase [Alkaliphilus metalliredigens QYMF]